MACLGMPACTTAWVMRYGVHGSCGPGLSSRPICIGKVGSLLDAVDPFREGDVAERIAGPVGVAHGALDEDAVGSANVGQGLAGSKVDNLVDDQTLGPLTPA